MAEGLLQVACRLSPSVRLALRPWDPPLRYLPDLALGAVGNPELPEHDAEGFRNPRGMGHAEVVVLGDSNTYGHRLAPEEAWPRVLEGLLGERLHRATPIFNMAMAGYGPVQFALLAERALAHEPRLLVVCYYLGNDLFNAYSMTYMREVPAAPSLRDPAVAVETMPAPFTEVTPRIVGHGRTGLGGWAERLSQYSQLAALVRTVRLRILERDAYGGRAAGWREDQWSGWRQVAARDPQRYRLVEHGAARTVLEPERWGQNTRLEDPRVAAGLDVLLRATDEIVDRASSLGVRTLFVVLPTKERVAAGLPECAADAELSRLERDEAEVEAAILRAARQHGVETFSALAPLRQALEGGRNPYFENDNSHLSAEGHRIVAEALIDAVADAVTDAPF